MVRHSIGRSLVLIGLLPALAPSASADAPKAFVPPKNAAEWTARRPVLHRAAEAAVAPKRIPVRAPSLMVGGREMKDGMSVETITLDGGTPGVLVLPRHPANGEQQAPSPESRVPIIILVSDPGVAGRRAVDVPGHDGQPDALSLARFGYAVLALDGADAPTLRMAIDAVLTRTEIDPDRIAIIGLGAAGPVALGLMAVDERIACGVVGLEADTIRRPVADVYGPEAAEKLESRTWADALAALCSPRPLSLIVGERIPLRNDSPGRRVERAVKGTYRSANIKGMGVAFTHHGEFAGHETIATRLQWMAAQEHFDKAFRPQGPAPLGHAPEPEPEVGPDALNLSEQGMAGWAAEMAQRPDTWTWADGVIRCQPGPNEYGWLRLPVEVGNFVLRIEWKVPPKGNAGIFLRARPVPWAFAPSDRSKVQVGALGLDWPSRSGLELQAQDDPGVANRYSSGSLYRHAAPATNPTHPPGGEWNRYTVRARGTRVDVWSNGTQVLDTLLDQHPETLPTLPTPPLRGYIGLQNHGAPAEYRNVRLIRLPD
ncbi:family 16 glycoside hydrolase [Tundrisphaera sp. TA3]|uniref:family 16 glycoside hydrolase n=1 Tax=Tundrisphaera sp. TA3 TaxID=3435775 RepID=UPI003EBB9CDE